MGGFRSWLYHAVLHAQIGWRKFILAPPYQSFYRWMCQLESCTVSLNSSDLSAYPNCAIFLLLHVLSLNSVRIGKRASQPRRTKYDAHVLVFYCGQRTRTKQREQHLNQAHFTLIATKERENFSKKHFRSENFSLTIMPGSEKLPGDCHAQERKSIFPLAM